MRVQVGGPRASWACPPSCPCGPAPDLLGLCGSRVWAVVGLHSLQLGRDPANLWTL